MNIDYTLKATPGVARRLIALEQITKLNICDGLRNLADQNRIQPEQLQGNIASDEYTLPFVQWAVDCDYRFIYGATSFNEAADAALHACLVNPSNKILIIDGLESVRTVQSWALQLKKYDLAFERVNKSHDTFNPEAQIVVANAAALEHGLLSKVRDRILVWIPNRTIEDHPGQPFDMNRLFGSAGKEIKYDNLHSLAREFRHTMTAFILPKKDHVYSKEWWKASYLHTLIASFHPTVKAPVIFSLHHGAVNTMASNGYLDVKPKALARLLGVYTGLIG